MIIINKVKHLMFLFQFSFFLKIKYKHSHFHIKYDILNQTYSIIASKNLNLGVIIFPNWKKYFISKGK